MSNDRKRDEKNRLWNEVLGSKRAYESTDASDHISLTIDANEKNADKSALKSSNDAMAELNRILQKQKKDIEELTKQTEEIRPLGVSEMDLDKMEADLQKDYGVKEKPEDRQDFDSKKIFDDIYNTITSKIMGQKDAMRQMITAFRRPYVMGIEEGHAKNVILVSGPQGSGRHAAVTEMARSLYEKKVFDSPEVATIDLSRYTSGAQESIFLQDLYQALKSKGSVICFEGFETGFPAFLRMVNSLVTTGKVVLNKRYVLTKGILVENQTGLVENAVNSLSAEGKYLIFMTKNKPEKVQDSFGADFMYHVLDVVVLKPLDEEASRQVIAKQKDELVRKAGEHLKIKVTVDEKLNEWVETNYNKDEGADGITSLFYDFYISLSQFVLNENLGAQEEISVIVDNNVPTAIYQDHKLALVREKTSQEEIDAVNKELDQIVGLEEVKKYVRSLQSHIAMNEKRRAQGMKVASVSKHMIFTGNPGTGKTTIARLLSRYMKAIGALSEGQLVEVTRADLVAQYVGQTAPLTMNVIKSAIGGVLFIDEAYSLYRGKDDSFGLQAIDTLVKAMEDNRDNLIVILAGYSKEMSVFLESNSGLKSRFPNLINFPDYTGEELQKIAILQAKGKGYVVDEEAKAPLKEYFDKVQSINSAEAGNGRLARNTIEEAILKQSQRLVKEPDGDISLLKKEDFDFTIKVKAPEKKTEPGLDDLKKMLNQ